MVLPTSRTLEGGSRRLLEVGGIPEGEGRVVASPWKELGPHLRVRLAAYRCVFCRRSSWNGEVVPPLTSSPWKESGPHLRMQLAAYRRGSFLIYPGMERPTFPNPGGQKPMSTEGGAGAAHRRASGLASVSVASCDPLLGWAPLFELCPLVSSALFLLTGFLTSVRRDPPPCGWGLICHTSFSLCLVVMLALLSVPLWLTANGMKWLAASPIPSGRSALSLPLQVPPPHFCEI